MNRWRATFHSHHRKAGPSAENESTDIDLSFDVEASDRESAYGLALSRVRTALTPDAFAHFTGPDTRWYVSVTLGHMDSRSSGHAG